VISWMLLGWHPGKGGMFSIEVWTTPCGFGDIFVTFNPKSISILYTFSLSLWGKCVRNPILCTLHWLPTLRGHTWPCSLLCQVTLICVMFFPQNPATAQTWQRQKPEERNLKIMTRKTGLKAWADCIGLGWCALDWIGVSWVGSGWVGLSWVGLG
jgi:hypothetical protein